MHKQQCLILDGGMGRELARAGAPFRQPEWSALALMEAPHTVSLVHQAYIDAGALVITTNSYALVPFHIGQERFNADGESLAALAGQLARQCVLDNPSRKVRVAGSLPPLFGSYRPDLFKQESVKDIAKPLIAGLSSYIDFWLIETQSSIVEVKSIHALLPKDNKEFWVSFTLQDEDLNAPPQLRSGELVEQAVEQMANLGAATILFNCCQPEVIEAALKVTQECLSRLNKKDIHFGAYANAFPPQPKEATANDGLDDIRADLDPESYLKWAQKWQLAGATRIGGCCGIGPKHIEKLADFFDKVAVS